MKRIHFFLKVVFISLAFASCNPNDDGPSSSQNDDTFAENFGAAVNRDFIGQVVDKDNHPIQGVTVSIGTSTAQTDINGVFIINNANVNQKFAYIQAKKTGYIDGSRAMVPTTGKNNVKIMLLPNTPVATIQSGQSSEVALPSGTKVTFDGAFQDENGADYSGAVNVAMFHLTTSDENIDKLMPGMLYAQRSNNEEAVLATFGMLNVELKGASGQKLNIKSGHTAEISMLIDDTQLSTAPSTIPLWHFDETKGYWKEDGIATKVGNKYIGEVSHFSWWNCDVFSSTVNLQITIVYGDQIPIVSATVVLTTANGITGTGTTDEFGNISGPIPTNEIITVTVYDICNNELYSSIIGPFSSDESSIISISSVPFGSSKRVSGVLTGCNGLPVENGYAILKYTNQSLFSSLSNGAFDFAIIACPDSNLFSLVGVDYENSQYTGDISYTFSPGLVDLGKIPVCSNFDEFITFKVNDLPSVILVSDINHNSWPGTPYFNADFIVSSNLPYGAVPAFEMELIENFTIGTPTSFGSLSVWYFNGTMMTYLGFGLYTPEITINKYDSPGGYVDFTFNCVSGSGFNLRGIGHVRR
jgi:hypothetical protein